MLTKRGRAALGLSLLLLVVGRILGVAELFCIAAAAVALVGLGMVRVRLTTLRLNLSARVVPPVMAEGEPATLELLVENSGPVSSPPGRVRLESPGGASTVELGRLLPGDRVSIPLALPPGRRGRQQTAGYEAVLTDAVGTARRVMASAVGVRYAVRPARERLAGTLPAGEGGTSLETTRSAAERLGSGASLLRPYEPGDDLRLIHWATTARVDELMVREGGDREIDASSGCVVVLLSAVYPAPRAAEDFESSCRAAASILSAAEREGSFRLVVQGGGDSGEGFGPRHLDAVLDSLCDVRCVLLGEKAPPLLPRSASSLGSSVVFVVGAAPTPEVLSSLLGSEPQSLSEHRGGTVELCCGALESSISQPSPDHVLVSLAARGSLGSLWARPGVVSTR